MMSSPLVTYAQSTQSSTAAGIYASIDRRDSFCASLGNRLGLVDPCNLFGTQAKAGVVASLTQAVPSDAYARGAEEPMMPTDANLFFVSATSNVCHTLATQLFDAAPGPGRYQSTDDASVAHALGDLVATVMGVPELNAVLKERSTAAQRNFIDALVTSRKQVGSISDALLGNLASINSDGADGQIAAAVTLIAMNIAPVMVVSIPFGGDNHGDPGLLVHETPEHALGIGFLGQLMGKLAAANLRDKVTFGLLNVFGRTLKNQGTVGRTHWPNHHAGILIGKSVNAGVVGGLEPNGNDYAATSIDPHSGRRSPAQKATSPPTRPSVRTPKRSAPRSASTAPGSTRTSPTALSPPPTTTTTSLRTLRRHAPEQWPVGRRILRLPFTRRAERAKTPV